MPVEPSRFTRKTTEALQSAPGSVAQVRECAAQLTRLAKQRGIVVIFVGHVTKEGAIAGPRVLEHIVDTVLYFEGDPHSSFRLVRAIKNRFGAANELGVFGMTERGLKGVANPSALFLSQHAEPVPGSAIVATLEGSRPLLVEIQALVDPVQGGTPKRLAVGLDPQRLALLLAVLHRHGGVQTGGYDVFVNAVGGVRINEPAADLAIDGNCDTSGSPGSQCSLRAAITEATPPANNGLPLSADHRLECRCIELPA